MLNQEHWHVLAPSPQGIKRAFGINLDTILHRVICMLVLRYVTMSVCIRCSIFHQEDFSMAVRSDVRIPGVHECNVEIYSAHSLSQCQGRPLHQINMQVVREE